MSLRSRLAFIAGAAVGIGLVTWNRRRAQERATLGRGPVTQAIVPTSPADMPMGSPGDNLEERLDEALHESFPASDPVSVHIE